MFAMIDPEDRDRIRNVIESAIDSGTPFRGIPYTDAYGHVVRVVGFNHDITEQTRIEDDLRRLSRQLLTLCSEE
jgi:hypothetical protein